MWQEHLAGPDAVGTEIVGGYDTLVAVGLGRTSPGVFSTDAAFVSLARGRRVGWSLVSADDGAMPSKLYIAGSRGSASGAGGDSSHGDAAEGTTTSSSDKLPALVSCVLHDAVTLSFVGAVEEGHRRCAQNLDGVPAEVCEDVFGLAAVATAEETEAARIESGRRIHGRFTSPVELAWS